MVGAIHDFGCSIHDFDGSIHEFGRSIHDFDGSIRHSDSSFRRFDLPIRRFGISFRRSDSSFRRFGLPIRHPDFFPSLRPSYPSPRLLPVASAFLPVAPTLPSIVPISIRHSDSPIQLKCRALTSP
ncbi:hypothetical protein [Lysinibacillus sphaericus]|uniref:hypothetical protein n=1 Tax=Lysinibacillus sphaericus TaxID=1421 RepID=UPI001CC1A2AC|nr:hypothetical protein [Lysinibacillus sphaericus]